MAADFHAAKVYTNIQLRSHMYTGIELVWDGPGKMVLIAFCADQDALRTTRDDVLRLIAILPQVGIHKKLHLVLIHDERLTNAADQPWPAGISFSPIALDPEKEPESAVNGVAVKLASILDMNATEKEVAAYGLQPPDWRRFLQDDPEVLINKVKQLAKGKGELPANLREHIVALLEMVQTRPQDLQAQVHKYLDNLWEVRHDAVAATDH